MLAAKLKEENGIEKASVMVTSGSNQVPAAKRKGNNFNSWRSFTWKSRPESGLDCLICATFCP